MDHVIQQLCITVNEIKKQCMPDYRSKKNQSNDYSCVLFYNPDAQENQPDQGSPRGDSHANLSALPSAQLNRMGKKQDRFFLVASWEIQGSLGTCNNLLHCTHDAATEKHQPDSRHKRIEEHRRVHGCKDTFALKKMQMRCRIDADARVHRRGAPSLPLPTGHARATSSSLHGVLRMRRSLLMGKSPAAHRWSLPDRARFRRGAAAKAVNGRRRIQEVPIWEA